MTERQKLSMVMESEDFAEKNPYVHLHVHSEYSLTDGSIRISELIEKVKSLGHNAVALTDHGNLFGALEFYNAAKKAGIKPIIGSEIYHQGNEATRKYLKEMTSPLPFTSAFHLVLLCKNKDGYNSLIKIVSSGYLEDPSCTVPISAENFLDQTGAEGGLVALSSCLRGEFSFLVSELRANQVGKNKLNFTKFSDKGGLVYEALCEHVRIAKERFREHYYIEIIDNNLPMQKLLLPDIIAVAAHFNLPMVVTCDAHYLDKESAEAHAVLLGIKNELTMSQMRDRLANARFHLLDNEEFREIYGQYPEAIANTTKIAEMCNLELGFGKYFLPKYPLASGASAEELLVTLSEKGLEERLRSIKEIQGFSFDTQKENEYRERLTYELSVIKKMGFAGYFLIVQDFINWAKNQGIPVGPGRGSGAGSLVAYAIGITDIDPVPYNLFFERFLNPERVSMPDFDVDFCQERRDEVIRYVGERYGKDRVAQITTFGKMLAKAAVRDVGRVLDISYSKVDRIAKLIPNELGITLADALEREPKIREEAKKDAIIGDLLQIAQKLEGLCRHASVHAAGVVISDGPMTDYIPVYRTEEVSLITQYEMKSVEKIGLVKFDFLALRTLTVIDKAIKLIKKKRCPGFEISRIPLDDHDVYDEISKGHTVGIFQVESQGMQQAILKLQPRKFEDLIATVALFRPGPMIMLDDFIERKHGRQKINYIVPQLEPILKDTYGCFLFQEEVLQTASQLANFSLGEADLLRRAMGKKNPEEMAKQRHRFVSGCIANNILEAKAQEIFELMANFADYGFNKAHSTAYALIAYQTAYLKKHFPEEFMAALMTSDLDNTDKITRYIDECRRMGFNILPPNVNVSELYFSVPEPKTISFGLAAIKGIGIASIAPLLEERTIGGPFKSLEDLSKRLNLPRVGKKTLELLTQGGGFDSIEQTKSRRQIFDSLPELVKRSESFFNAKAAGQRSLFGEDVRSFDLNISANENLKASLPDNGAKRVILPEWLFLEKKLLGAFLSGHPLDFYREDLEKFGKAKICDLEKFAGKENVVVVGILSGLRERIAKSGNRILYVKIEDQHGAIEGIMFDKNIPPSLPEIQTPVVVFGSVSVENNFTRYRIDKLLPLEIVRKSQVKELLLTLSFKGEESISDIKGHTLFINRLKEMLVSFQGDVPLKLSLKLKNARLVIKPKSCRVNITNEFMRNILQLSNQEVSVNCKFNCAF